MGKSSTKPDVKGSKLSKRLRDQSNDETTSSKKPKVTFDSLQLIDINDDCLEVIFKSLDLTDLLNVSESHDRFVAIARSIYSRRYQMKKVWVNLSSIFLNVAPKDNAELEIGNEIAVLFFRQFGHLVSNLSLNYMAQHAINIEKSVLKHCSDSITVLELMLCHGNNLETLNEPLEKVKELTITKSIIGPKLSMLSNWFPNLISLKLVQVELVECKALEVNFSQLKHLVIFNKEQTIPQTTIGELLRVNPQLESLNLQCKLDADFLWHIAEHMRQVKTLELWASNDRFESFADKKVSFDYVNVFKLNSWFHWGEFLVNMPFKFTKLDKLMLDGFNEFQGEMLKFIKQNQAISVLSLLPYIEDWDDLAFDDLESIIDSLPKLIELEFCADMFTEEQLIRLLSKYKNLKDVRLAFLELPNFVKNLGKAVELEWVHAVKMGCTEHNMQYVYVEFKRKS